MSHVACDVIVMLRYSELLFLLVLVKLFIFEKVY